MSVATIVSLEGTAWIRDPDGTMREAEVGDVLEAGQVLISAEGALVELDFGNNQIGFMAGNQSVLMTDEMGLGGFMSPEEAAIYEETLASVLNALENEGDVLENVDSTAAGSGGEGGGDGSEAPGTAGQSTGARFSRIQRVAEESETFSFDDLANGGDDTGQVESLLNRGGDVLEDALFSTSSGADANALPFSVNPINGTGPITGTAPQGTRITVTFPNGEQLSTGANDDHQWQVDNPGLGDLHGEDITVVATDPDGNVIGEDNVPVDAEAPDAPVVNPVSVNGNISGTAEPGSSIQITLPNGEVVAASADSDGDWSVRSPGLQRFGDSELQVTAQDAAGNVSAVTTVPIYAGPPADVTLTGPEGGVSNTGEIEVSGVLPAATWEYSIDGGGTWTTGTGSSFQIPEGGYDAGDIQVRQIDPVGNVSHPAQLGALTVDTTAPDAPLVESTTNQFEGDGNPTGTEVTGTAEPGSTVELRDADGNVVGSADADGNGEFTIVTEQPLADGENYQAVAIDGAGNESSVNSFALDATAGDLTVDTVTVDDAAQTVALSGSSTDVGDGETVNLTITDQNGNTVTATATVDANGEYSVTGVDVSTLTDGPLTIDAAATDNNGDAVTAQDNSAALDATAGDLTVDTVTVDDAAQTVALSGSSTDVGDGETVNLTITDQNGNTVTATATVDANGEYSVTGVDVSTLTDGPLTIDAAATDNNGDAVTAQDNSAALDATAGDLTVDTVTVDDAAQTVALSGSSTDVGDGETVNLTITDQNGNTVTATATVDANGEYSVTGVDVSTLTDGPLTIDAAATDNNGDAVTAQDNSAALDATAGDLTVDTVTVDDAAQTVALSGSSTDVGDGETVNLTITDQNGNTVTATATVDANGEYSVTGVDVSTLTDGPLTIDAAATDNNGDAVTAQDNSAALDATAGDLTVDTVTVDDAAQTVALSGSSTDVGDGETVNLTITDQNGNTVTATATVDANGEYSVTGVDVSTLTDGPLTIDAAATDNNGDAVTAQDNSAALDATAGDLTVDTVTVDDAAQTVALSGSSTDVGDGETVNLTITDQNGNTVTATATVDANGEYSVTGVDVSTLTDGPLTIDAAATDNNGDAVTAQDNSAALDATAGDLTVDTVTVDDAAQTVALSGSSTDVGDGETVNLTITDQNGNTVTATATVDANGEYSVTGVDVSTLTDGPLTIDAAATDNNGDAVTAQDNSAALDATAGDLTVDTVTVDDAAQTVALSGSSTDVGDGETVNLTITDQNGNTVTATATVDANGEYSVTGVDVSTLTDGPLTIDAAATDNNGDAVTAQDNSAALDATAGDLTVDTVTVDDAAQTVALSGSSTDVGDGETVNLTITDQNGNTVTATATVDANGEYSVTGVDVSTLTDGPLTIDAAATDNNGDAVTAQDNSAALDATAGDLTVDTVTVDDAAQTVALSGSSTDVGDGETVNLTITDQNGNTVTATATVDANGEYSVTGVDVSTLTDGPLTIDAAATDNNGDAVTAQDNSAALDATAGDLTVDTVTVDDAAQTVALSGSSTDVGDGETVNLTITDQNGNTVTATATVDANGEYSVTGVDVSTLTDGPLTIDAAATDNNGDAVTAQDNSAALDATAGDLTVDTVTVDDAAQTVALSGSSTDVGDGETVNLTITDQNGNTVTATATVDANGEYSVTGVDVSTLTDGPLTIDAAATDNNGDAVTAQDNSAALDATAGDLTVDTVTVDDAAQTVALSGSSTDVGDGETVNLTITDQNGNTVTATATVDANGEYSVTGVDVSTLTDGPLTIDAAATDNNGDAVTAQDNSAALDATAGDLTVDTVTVDDAAQTVALSGSSTDVGDGETVNLTITDQNGNTVTATATVDANGEYSVTGVDVSTLTDGPLTIDAAATDNNGDAVTAQDNSAALDATAGDLTVDTVTVDDAAQTVALSGSSTDVGDGETVNLTITDQNGNTVTATATVDANGEYSVTGVDVSTLTDGPLTIDAAATDNNGDAVTAQDNSAALDATAGDLTVDTVTVDDAAQTVALSGSSTDVGDGETVNLTITDQNGNTVTATATVDANGEYSVTGVDVSTLTDGPLTIDAAATDNNGDAVTAQDNSAALDATAGDLTVDTVTVDDAAQTVALSGSSTDVGDGETVNLTITDQNGNTVTATATVDANGEYSVTGVDVSTLTDGPLTIDAAATDNNGDAVTAQDNSAALDATAGDLTVDTVTVDDAAQTVALSGSSTDVGDGETVNLTITDQNGNTVTATATVDANGEYSVTGVDVSTLTDGPLTIDAAATDNNGDAVTAQDNSAALDATAGDLTVDTVTVDDAAQTVALSGSSTDVGDGETVNLTITDQNGNTVTATATVDANGEYSVTGVDVSTLTDGPLTIDAAATDNNGDAVTAQDNSAALDATAGDLTVDTVTVDDAAQTVALSGSSTDVGDGETVNLTITDQNGNTVTATATVDANGEYSVTGVDVSTLTDGPLTIDAAATDNNGDAVTAQDNSAALDATAGDLTVDTVTVDDAAQTVALSGSSTDVGDGETVNLTITDQNGNTVTATATVDANGEYSVTGVDVSTLTDGPLTIDAAATDNNGDAVTAQDNSAALDATAGDLTVDTVTVDDAAQTVALSGSSTDVGDGETVNLTITDQNGNTVTATATVDANGEYSVTGVDVSTLTDGPLTIDAAATDNNGDAVTAQDNSAALDATAGDLTVDTVTVDDAAQTVALSGSSTDVGDGETVNLTITDQNGNTVTATATVDANGEYSVTGVDVSTLTDGPLTIDAAATDNNGDAVTAQDNSAALDATAGDLTVDTVTVDDAAQTVALSGSSTDVGDGETVNLTITDQNGNTVTATATVDANGEYSVTGVDVSTLTDGPLTIDAAATDNNGDAVTAQDNSAALDATAGDLTVDTVTVDDAAQTVALSGSSTDVGDGETVNLTITDQNGNTVTATATVDANGEYSVTGVDVSTLTDGPLTIDAAATDNNGDAVTAQDNSAALDATAGDLTVDTVTVDDAAQTVALSGSSTDVGDGETVNLTITDQNGNTVTATATVDANGEYSVTGVDVSTLTDGPLTIDAAATDNNGDAVTAQDNSAALDATAGDLTVDTVTVDDAAQTVALSGSSTDVGDGETVNLTITDQNGNTVTATATVDANGEYSVTGVDVSTLTDGPLTIDAAATDNNGDAVTAQDNSAALDATAGDLTVDTVTVDDAAQTVALSGSSTDVGDGETVNLTITDQNGNTVTATATVDANGEYSVTGVDVSTLTDGPLTIDAAATDNNGDAVTAQDNSAALDATAGDLTVDTVTVDDAAQTVALSGSSTDVGDGETVNLTITDQNGNTVTATATVDANGEYSVTGVDVSTLTDGPLTIDAAATDNNGDAVTAQDNSAALDATAGDLTVDTVTVDDAAQTVALSGSSTDVGDGETVNLTITDQNGNTVTATATVDANGEYSVTGVDVSTLTDGPLTIDAAATDNNGDAVTAQDNSAALDATAGDLTVDTVTVDDAAQTVALSGSSTDVGDGETVNLTITDQNGNTVTATATVDANGEYSVTGVDVSTLTDGPLTIDAAATDNNGDAVTAQDNSAALDATAGDLTVDTVTVDDAAQTVALSGSSTDVGDGETVNLTITDQNGNTVTATATVDANGEYSVTGVDVSTLTDGPLTIDAAATDNNGDAVTAQDNSAALDATAGDLTVDTVTVDDAAQTVALSGSSTDVGDGETVNLTITDQNGNTVTATATVDANGEYSVTGVDVSTLTDGPLTIDAAATDNNGDAVTAQDNSAALDATAGDLTVDTVTVDDAAQTVALSGSSTDVGDGETVNLTITDQNGNTVTATATVDANGEYSVTGVDVSTLTDGPLTIDAAATDNNGDAVTAQDNSAALDATAGDLTVDTVTVDDAAQTVALSGSSTDVGDGETVNLTITDQNGNTVTATATVDANGEYSVTGVDVSTLTDGPLTIDAAATDNNGDAVTAQDNSAALDATAGDLTVDTVTVDDAAQTVALSGSSTDVGDGETVNLTITDQNGNTVTATATVDANGEYSVTGVDVSTLTDGPLTIDAAATDNNGDAVTAQDNSAALDATAGDLTVDTVTVDDAAQTVALSGSSTDVGDGETVNLTITDQNGNTVTATATVDANGEYSVTGVDVSTLTDGPLTIDAAATDNNGDAVTAQDNSAALDATAGDLTVDTVTVDDAAQTVALSGSSTDVGDGETVNLTITDQNGNTVTATATVDANGEYSVTGVDVSTLTDGPLTIDAAATDNNGDAVTAQDNSAALDAVEEVEISAISAASVGGATDIIAQVWGSLDNDNFAVVSNAVDTQDDNQTLSPNWFESNWTRNLELISTDGSNDTYLMSEGDTYQVTWQEWANGGWQTREIEATVTRSDQVDAQGGDRDIVVLSGQTENGNTVSLIIDSEGVETGWNVAYYANDQHGTNVGFRGIEVTGTSEPGAEVVLSDEDGNVLATITADGNGQWAAVLDQVASDTGEITATATDPNGMVSVDTLSYDLSAGDSPGGDGSVSTGSITVTDFEIDESGSVEVPLDEALAASPQSEFALATSADGINLTSMGVLTGDDGETYTVWRLRNGTEDELDVSLSAYGNGSADAFTVPANSDLFVTSTQSGTHVLNWDGGSATKAAGSHTFSYGETVPLSTATLSVTVALANIAFGSTLQLTVSDEQGNSTSVQVNATDAQTLTMPEVDLSGLEPGELDYSVSATGKDGNTAASAGTVSWERQATTEPSDAPVQPIITEVEFDDDLQFVYDGKVYDADDARNFNNGNYNGPGDSNANGNNHGGDSDQHIYKNINNSSFNLAEGESFFVVTGNLHNVNVNLNGNNDNVVVLHDGNVKNASFNAGQGFDVLYLGSDADVNVSSLNDNNGVLSGQLSVNGKQMTINNFDAVVVGDEIVKGGGELPESPWQKSVEIEGIAPQGSTVEVYFNDELIGTATVEADEDIDEREWELDATLPVTTTGTITAVAIDESGNRSDVSDAVNVNNGNDFELEDDSLADLLGGMAIPLDGDSDGETTSSDSDNIDTESGLGRSSEDDEILMVEDLLGSEEENLSHFIQTTQEGEDTIVHISRTGNFDDNGSNLGEADHSFVLHGIDAGTMDNDALEQLLKNSQFLIDQ